MFKNIDFNLMIFDKRSKGSLPKRFSDFVIYKNGKPQLENELNIDENNQPKPRGIKKKSVKSIINKRTPLSKNNSLKINANSIIIRKKKKCCPIQSYKQLLQEKEHLLKENDKIRDNFTLTFSIPKISNLFTLKTSNETIDDLRYKVLLKDCKPISKALPYMYNVINSIKDKKNIKEYLNLQKALELFLKFQPLVLTPRYEQYTSTVKISELKNDLENIKTLKETEDVSVSSLTDDIPAEVQTKKEDIHTCDDLCFQSVFLPEVVSQGSATSGSTCKIYSGSTSSDTTDLNHKITTQDDPLYLSNEICNIWLTSPPSEDDSFHLRTSSESCIDSSFVSEGELDNGEIYNLVPASQEIDVKEDKVFIALDSLGIFN